MVYLPKPQALSLVLPPNPGPLTSLSENLCFRELAAQAETGSAVDRQNKRVCKSTGKVRVIILKLSSKFLAFKTCSYSQIGSFFLPLSLSVNIQLCKKSY